MNNSACRPHQTLPFGARVRNACAQLMRTQARHRAHVVTTQHTPDPPTHPHREVWWFSINNSTTAAPLALPRGTGMRTHASHVSAHTARKDKR